MVVGYMETKVLGSMETEKFYIPRSFHRAIIRWLGSQYRSYEDKRKTFKFTFFREFTSELLLGNRAASTSCLLVIVHGFAQNKQNCHFKPTCVQLRS